VIRQGRQASGGRAAQATPFSGLVVGSSRSGKVFEPMRAGWRAMKVTGTVMESPFKFLQEVRAETQKVTWPTRRETAITTAMVFVMVAIASVFFLVADQVISLVVRMLIGLGG
jgi:preprotein translocase subunit SecE